MLRIMVFIGLILSLMIGAVSAQPQIRVEPDEIDEMLLTGEVAEYELTIENVGDEVLNFAIEHGLVQDEQRAPRRDDAGDLLGEFQGNNGVNQYSSCIGWDPDNEWMWISNYSNQNVVAWSHDGNYEDFEREVALQDPGACMDGTFANGMVYIGTWANPTIGLWDAEGERIRNIEFQHPVYGLAADEDAGLLFAMDSSHRNIHVYEFDDEGGIGDQIGLIEDHRPFQGWYNVVGLEWVEEHPDGQLWMTNGAGNRAFQISVDTEDWTPIEVVQSFEIGGNGQSYCTVAHDGTNLWASGYTADNIRIYDDGIDEFRWLRYEPDAGEIEPGEEAIVTITIDAHGLRGGQYETILAILTNDPQNDHIEVSVSFEICVPPWIPPEEILFPVTYVGRESVETFILENSSDEDLRIENIEIADGENFSLLTEVNDGIVISPNEEIEIELAFHPQDEGEFESNLLFIIDFPNFEDVVIPLIGRGVMPSRIQVEPYEIRTWGQDPEEIVDYELTISNVGDETLNFEIDHEILWGRYHGPRRDDPGDLIAQFQGNNGQNQYCSPAGWDKDNEMMWIINYNGATAAYSHDGNYEGFEEVVRINPGNCMDGTVLNGILYVNNLGQSEIQRYDGEGENLGNIEFNFEIYGAAADEDNQWLMVQESGNNYAIHVFEVLDDNEIGDEVGVINNHNQFHQNVNTYGIEWVEEHPDGQLWITNSQANTVSQISVDTDEWECTETIQTFDIGQIGQMYNAVAHDGENLWAGGYNAGNIRIYDDGNFDVRWLEYAPQAGQIEPGDDVLVTITLDSYGMRAGRYEAVLLISSNDPDNEEVEVPVIVNIYLPAWWYPWEYPVVFPNTYVGTESIQLLEMGNISTDVFTIKEFEVVDGDENAFSILLDDEDDIVMQPDDEIEIEISFRPLDRGEYHSEAGFLLDMGGGWEEWIFIELQGMALIPPQIAIVIDGRANEDGREWQVYSNVEYLYDENGEPVLDEDGVLIQEDQGGEDYVLTITNEGEEGADDLRWTICFENIEEERDQPIRHSRKIQSNLQAEVTDLSESNLYPPSDSRVWDEGYINNHSTANPPRRDDPPTADFALFQESNPWGYDIENIFERFDGISYERFQSWNDEFDLWDYDVIWIANYQSDEWNREYMDVLELVEEWVDDGGVLYHCTGTNNEFLPTHSGGLSPVNRPSNVAYTVAEPEDCLLFELMGWESGQRLTGSAFNHQAYPIDRIEEIENMHGYQVLVASEQNNGVPIVVRYKYGDGQCVVSGTTDGYLHNNPQQHIWGQTGEAMLWYLDNLSNQPNWISAEPDEGEIAPGESEDVTININAFGLEIDCDYYSNMIINSNDPEKEQIEIAVHLYVPYPPAPHPHWWSGEESEANHSVIIESLTFEGENVDGWIVGAFDNNEGNTCVGMYAQWEEGEDVGLVLWGDDPDTEVDEGYEDGQALMFRLYDPYSDTEYKGGQISVDYAEGPHVWTEDELTIINSVSAGTVPSSIDLHEGWNLISTNINPLDDYYDQDEDRGPSIIKMMAQLADDQDDLQRTHHVTLMKNGRGRFYSPANDYCNIDYWDVTQGYQVKVTEAIQISWIGEPISPDADIPIREGWNLIAYFPNYDLPMNVVDRDDPDNEFNMYAIRPIFDAVIIMKNGAGRFAYPSQNFSNMPDLTKGQGYQIKVDRDLMLNYPGPPRYEGLATVERKPHLIPKHITLPVPTQSNMSLLVMSDELQGDVGVYADNRLVGAGRLGESACGVAIWEDDASTDAIDGAREGDALEIRLINEKGLVPATFITIEGEPVYRADALWVVSANEVILPDDFKIASVYPNPFNAQTRISYHIPEAGRVDLRVYDIAGREVMTLFSGVRPAGVWSATVDARDLASGLYLVRMNANDQTFTKKVICVK